MSQAAEQFKKDYEHVGDALRIFNQYKTVGADYGECFEDEISIIWDMIGHGFTKRTEYIAQRYGGGHFSYYYDKQGIRYAECWYGEYAYFSQ